MINSDCFANYQLPFIINLVKLRYHYRYRYITSHTCPINNKTSSSIFFQGPFPRKIGFWITHEFLMPSLLAVGSMTEKQVLKRVIRKIGT